VTVSGLGCADVIDLPYKPPGITKP